MTQFTETHLVNLTKLADYLASLPEDYEDFEMENYNDFRPLDSFVGLSAEDARQHQCGSAACAIGHGPAAGIPVPKSLGDNPSGFEWDEYAELVFGISNATPHPNALGAFMFSSFWSEHADLPKQAAQRIRYVVEHKQAPQNWNYAWHETQH